MQVKNYLGECSLKVTRPNGERSEILVSNPGYTVYDNEKKTKANTN